jgi:hypothetical protein
MTMQLIETKTLGADAASIEFTSIPQTYTDLVALVSLRDTSDDVSTYSVISFNSNTSNFAIRVLEGSGSSVVSASFTSGTDARIITNARGNDDPANTFGNAAVYIPNYTGSTNKSYSSNSVVENNGTVGPLFLLAGLWSNTSAITSITFSTYGVFNFMTGSTISLYGILKGSDGIVTTS